MKGIFERLFPVLGVLAVVLFVGLVWKNYHPPYLVYQDRFKDLLKQKTETWATDVQFGVRQRWIEDLGRTDRCETCHLGADNPGFPDAPLPYKTHPVSTGHDFETFGCTVCHGGQGLAASREGAHGSTESFPRSVYHENFMENSCPLCHTEFIPENQAPVYANGRFLFQDLGCRGCHLIQKKERIKVGLPLKDMGRRVKPDWLFRWLLGPKGYFPGAKMPDYRLSEQESADIASLLLREGQPRALEITGSYDRGQKLFNETRCVSCHPVDGKGGVLAPELGKVSNKLYPERLLRVVKNPQELWPETEMPIFGFGDEEVQDIVAFMVEQYIDLELDETGMLRQRERIGQGNPSKGKELSEKYGCTGCHAEMEGVSDRGEIGVELTTIGSVHLSRLDFGNVHVAFPHRSVQNWLYNKVKNPRLFKEGLIMPDYRFGIPETEAVTTYLLSLRNEKIPPSYALALGRAPTDYDPAGRFGAIVDKYRCLVCHKINGRGGDMANDLSQEGSRLKRQWLGEFMKIPSIIRPLLGERMPQFKVLDSEIEALYDYFAAALVDDRVENMAAFADEIPLEDPGLVLSGKKLYFEKFACQACHAINLEGGVIAPDLTDAGKRLRAEWIVYYLKDPKAFVVRSVEPVYQMTEEEIKAMTAFIISPKEK